MTNPSLDYRNREIPTNEEIDAALSKADEIPNEYFRLRVKALIALCKKFGKRRKEIASVKVKDVKEKGGYLIVTFTIAKKHKKGLFQYLKFLKQSDPDALKKTYPELVEAWRSWRETELGERVRIERRSKKVKLEDKYAKMIVAYRDYVIANLPETNYLFPSGKAVFGSYQVNPYTYLSGRQLLRLIKPLNERLWLHLLRETKGAEISRDLGMTITAVTEVKNMLDLEREETAWNYVRRYAIQEAKSE